MKKLCLKIVSISLFLFALGNQAASAFPIFAPPSAYINCKNSGGFIGDNSNAALGFAGGTATGITWDGAKMLLNAATASGTFTSRVIDNSCYQLTPFLNLKWTTTLPYGKELATSNEATSAYSAISGSLLTNLIGIWRFNASSYTNAASNIADSSGLGRHATLFGAASVSTVTGKFNNGFPSTSALYGRIPAASLPTGTTANSHSLWFKGTTPGGYPAFAYRGNNGSYNWAIRMMTDGSVYMEVDTGTGVQQLFSSRVVTDGNWHHIGMSINGTNMNLFVDGTKFTTTYTNGTALNGRTDLFLTIFDTVPGTFDEVASWSRALTDAEMYSLYRRGANRVKFQVRTCPDSTCSTNPTWRGPDNTASTYFTEFNNNSAPTTGTGNPLTAEPTMSFSTFSSIPIANRYFQYKFILETDNTSYRPDVVTAGPSR